MSPEEQAKAAAREERLELDEEYPALTRGRMGSPGLDSGAFTGIKIVLEKLLAEYYGPSGILGAMD